MNSNCSTMYSCSFGSHLFLMIDTSSLNYLNICMKHSGKSADRLYFSYFTPRMIHLYQDSGIFINFSFFVLLIKWRKTQKRMHDNL